MDLGLVDEKSQVYLQNLCALCNKNTANVMKGDAARDKFDFLVSHFR